MRDDPIGRSFPRKRESSVKLWVPLKFTPDCDRGRGRAVQGRKDRYTMRYIIALATAILIVVMAWPYLRQFAPRRAQSGAPKPASRGELIYFAFLIVIALSFTISTMLWVFGK